MNYSKKTYYAHSMHIYGTDREIMERAFIESMGFEVVCPNRDLNLGNDMDAYLRIVRQCKRIICSEYSGYIGRGVYLEIKWAMRHDIPVYVLRGNSLYRVCEVGFFNEDDWKTTYGRITKAELITKDVLNNIPLTKNV